MHPKKGVLKGVAQRNTCTPQYGSLLILVYVSHKVHCGGILILVHVFNKTKVLWATIFKQLETIIKTMAKSIVAIKLLCMSINTPISPHTFSTFPISIGC